jgi:hypothetical protein
MRIYFAGIGGVGIGPLAAIAKEAGYDVSGYDLNVGPITEELQEKGISVAIGKGLSEITAAHQAKPIDWLVATAALPQDDPVIQFARDHHIRISKRDELINQLVQPFQARTEKPQPRPCLPGYLSNSIFQRAIPLVRGLASHQVVNLAMRGVILSTKQMNMIEICCISIPP